VICLLVKGGDAGHAALRRAVVVPEIGLSRLLL
jgi:hypothetical protein